MSATPEPKVRYWQDEDGALWHTTTAAGHFLAERGEAWQEVTVTPVVPQGAATPADERLCEAADRRGFVMLRDDATDDELARADREFVDAVRAALAASPADANTADLDSAVGIIEGVQHALALTKGARATAEERVYTTEANRLIHEKRERMLQARLTDGTTAGRTYARTGGDEHATTPPVAATSEEAS